MEKIIEVRHLKKSFGAVQAVQGIDLSVTTGHLFAFVGPNGAGKSTTIHMLTTFLQPDEGEILIAGYQIGKDDEQIKKQIGIVFQESVLDSLLTVEENLSIRGSFYELSKHDLRNAIERAMKETNIQDLAARRYGTLSGGQRRRVDIARALIHEPRILFLDEPTTGLDPQTRLLVWDTIDRLQREKGMTVFLTTHYMEEAAQADYVCVMDHGAIVAQGTPNDLKDRYSSDTLQIKPTDQPAFISQLSADHVSYKVQADTVIIPIAHGWDAVPLLQHYQSFIASFQVLNGTMDDAFVAITGKELRAE